jgi:phosphate:Na+ symporter
VSLELAGRLLGGVGLFLLGMRLLTDGLRVAAGQALREILARSTRTRLRAMASGALVTSLVQSSSAVTVATIGFVNAGLLTLGQALAVTYGSNVGTTMTGWLVATIGLHVDVRASAFPLIGIGVALRLGFRDGRVGALGEALAGFGLFFLGVDTLRATFEGLSDRIALGALVGGGALRVLLFVAIGFGLTVLMQSSSAAIALILTATGGGVVPLGTGAALVIGANVGTTSTAALAVIGATSNAKRVAAGHIAFNAITAAVALALLPLLLAAIVRGREILQLDTQPAATLAGFHTLFNLLGVALLWPFTNRLLHLLEGRFRTREEDEATPRYLDRHVIATPDLAVDALVLELVRVGQIARRLADAALADEARARGEIPAGRRSLMALVDAVGEYTQLLQRARLPAELDEQLPNALRVSRYYLEASELAELVASGRLELVPPKDPQLAQELAQFVAQARSLTQLAGIEVPDYTVDRLGERIEGLEARYQQLKASLLAAGSAGVLPVNDLVSTLDWLSNVRRVAEQIERGARFLSQLRALRT